MDQTDARTHGGRSSAGSRQEEHTGNVASRSDNQSNARPGWSRQDRHSPNAVRRESSQTPDVST
ncbi:hypothetical protein OUZ56_025961 [Daphnia magna]|uniref:Uncharacterized protein n=1 Tax=Daphnia magna TaxID=35525 RepID=A0ABQ9ZKF4_9CRUS|nr:hypothetical protein OUZ56_025704 [Daphnia magna]KAK4013401.1 hypothetical protein OUZ56_025943 [Daphnia magna]KAK4013411.1 hypothetical protein OUZ56_025961 [Daphnia magna]